VTEGLVFGGKTLTTTDILVASGKAGIGDTSRVQSVPMETVDNATQTIHDMLDHDEARR